MIKNNLLFLLILFQFCFLFSVAFDKNPPIDSIIVSSDSSTVQNPVFLDSLTNNVLYKNPSKPLGHIETPSFGSMLFRMIASLLVIIIVLYLVLRFVKQLNQGNDLLSQKRIRIIETTPVGIKHTIQLVLINKKIYILSSSANSTILLDKIENPEDVDSIVNEKINDKKDFKSLFDKIKQMNKKGKLS